MLPARLELATSRSLYVWDLRSSQLSQGSHILYARDYQMSINDLAKKENQKVILLPARLELATSRSPIYETCALANWAKEAAFFMQGITRCQSINDLAKKEN